jgi:subtilisin family serine protease
MSIEGFGSDDGNCGRTNNDPVHLAICNAVEDGDVTFVVAAGNSGTNFASTIPAAYDEVLTATAIADFNGASGGGAAATCRSDADDTAADSSNYAATDSADAAHTIAAPGVCIRSTWKNKSYTTMSGTSMAAPHVAGTAALCIASGDCNGMNPGQVAARLRADAADQPASYGFAGDPRRRVPGRYYGYLVHVAGY